MAFGKTVIRSVKARSWQAFGRDAMTGFGLRLANHRFLIRYLRHEYNQIGSTKLGSARGRPLPLRN